MQTVRAAAVARAIAPEALPTQPLQVPAAAAQRSAWLLRLRRRSSRGCAWPAGCCQLLSTAGCLTAQSTCAVCLVRPQPHRTSGTVSPLRWGIAPRAAPRWLNVAKSTRSGRMLTTLRAAAAAAEGVSWGGGGERASGSGSRGDGSRSVRLSVAEGWGCSSTCLASRKQPACQNGLQTAQHASAAGKCQWRRRLCQCRLTAARRPPESA